MEHHRHLLAPTLHCRFVSMAGAEVSSARRARSPLGRDAAGGGRGFGKGLGEARARRVWEGAFGEKDSRQIEMGAGIAASPHCAERRICRYS